MGTAFWGRVVIDYLVVSLEEAVLLMKIKNKQLKRINKDKKKFV